MMKESLEVERKWLLKNLPSIKDFDFKETYSISQYYLSPTERLRQSITDKTSTYQHFIKEWQGEGCSKEQVTSLTVKEFTEQKLSAVKVIFKDRSECKWNDKRDDFIYEIDLIRLSPSCTLTIMEIEFPSLEVSQKYTLPKELQEYVIMEVTNHREFSNYELSLKIEK